MRAAASLNFVTMRNPSGENDAPGTGQLDPQPPFRNDRFSAFSRWNASG